MSRKVNLADIIDETTKISGSLRCDYGHHIISILLLCYVKYAMRINRGATSVWNERCNAQ